jgi:hypothetical protein
MTAPHSFGPECEECEGYCMHLAALAREHGGIRSGSFDAVKQWTFTEDGLAKFALAVLYSALQGEQQQTAIYEQRLRAVLEVVRRYLPPDGIGEKRALSEIIGLVDPWPALEQQGGVRQEPVAWQWRRKGEPWSLERTFNSEVKATTKDSEVRALYAAPQCSRPQQEGDERVSDEREAFEAAMGAAVSSIHRARFGTGYLYADAQRAREAWQARAALAAVPAAAQEPRDEWKPGMCLPNGVLFDWKGNTRVRYVRVTHDGTHCVVPPDDVQSLVDSERPEDYQTQDVYLSKEEFDALPEFDGF